MPIQFQQLKMKCQMRMLTLCFLTQYPWNLFSLDEDDCNIMVDDPSGSG